MFRLHQQTLYPNFHIHKQAVSDNYHFELDENKHNTKLNIYSNRVNLRLHTYHLIQGHLHMTGIHRIRIDINQYNIHNKNME